MFNILDYLDKLEVEINNGTWIQAKCPGCGGKLKINAGEVKKGAYACYTNECHTKFPNPIKKALVQYNAFNRLTSFDKKQYSYKKLTEIIKPIDIFSAAEDFLTEIEFIKPIQTITTPNSYTKELLTIYSYTDFDTIRIDRKTNKETEKFFYQRFYKDSEEIRGLPEQFIDIPVYQSKYIQPSILWVEGEKCATLCHKLNMAALTFPTFLNETLIQRYIYLLKKKNVSNVLYIQDNDKPGLVKAKKLCECFWKNNIAAKYINLTDIYPEYKKIQGFDIVDLYKKKLLTLENKLELLNTLIHYES